jgi:hypothetical protein
VKLSYFTALMSDPGEDPRRYQLVIMSGDGRQFAASWGVAKLELEHEVGPIVRQRRADDAKRVLAAGLKKHDAVDILREMQARGWLPCRP